MSKIRLLLYKYEFRENAIARNYLRFPVSRQNKYVPKKCRELNFAHLISKEFFLMKSKLFKNARSQ